MELTHDFTVPAPIDDAWAAFNDLERIAPCFPGAALTSYDGEAFEGLVKVKLGPISLQYNGTGTFVERDESAHHAVIEAKGKDRRGNGTAAAKVTADLSAVDAGSTQVTVTTDLNITGKPAQFGRGVMQEVSDKLLAQFSTCLETKLFAAAEEAPAEDAVLEEAVVEDAAVEDAAVDDAPTVEAADEEEPVRASATDAPAVASVAPATEHAELDLGATVVPVILRRFGPYIVATLVGLWILKRLLGRRRG